MFPNLRIWGGELDNVPGCTNPVKGNMTWEPLTGVNCTGYHTPCHTQGHVCYYFDCGVAGPVEPVVEVRKQYTIIKNLNRFYATGDTIFTGGCGRFFEGNAEEMVACMNLARSLPEDT